MNIADKIKKVIVPINHDRLVPPLKKRARAILAAIDPAGVSKSDILHQSGEGDVSNLNSEMNVIGHQAKGMNATTESLDNFCKSRIKVVTIVLGKEEVLVGFSSQDNVIESTGVVYSGLTCHAVD